MKRFAWQGMYSYEAETWTERIAFSLMRDFMEMRDIGHRVLAAPMPRLFCGERNWFRLPFRHTDAPIGLSRAWHGTSLRSLYAIVRNGLLSSADETRGQRFLPGGAGVYCFRDTLARKALHYCVYDNPFQNFTWWTVLFEVLVDETARVVPRVRTDQSIYRPDGVRLSAVWIRGLRQNEMTAGVQSVFEQWTPKTEVHPEFPEQARF